MKKQESGANILKGGTAFFAVAASVCMLFLAGCGSVVNDNASAEMKEEIGFQEYADAAVGSEEEGALEPAETESQTVADAGAADGAGEDAQAFEAQDKILVYEGAVAIETMEFEDTVRAFKKAVQECGGFLEEQSYGAGSQYAEESFIARRIPRLSWQRRGYLRKHTRISWRRRKGLAKLQRAIPRSRT